MLLLFHKKLVTNEMEGSATPIFKHTVTEYFIISELNINTPARWVSQVNKTGICRKHWDMWGNTRASKEKTREEKDRAYAYSLGGVLTPVP